MVGCDTSGIFYLLGNVKVEGMCSTLLSSRLHFCSFLRETSSLCTVLHQEKQCNTQISDLVIFVFCLALNTEHYGKQIFPLVGAFNTVARCSRKECFVASDSACIVNELCVATSHVVNAIQSIIEQLNAQY
jgi:hypothetical protein